jgi:apolipoprotein D and lipocalin family protein
MLGWWLYDAMGLASLEEAMTGVIEKIAMTLNRNHAGTLGHLRRIFAGLLLLVGDCTGKPDGVVPVSPFDVQRYKGEWFEIMRLDHSFERGLTNVTATYTLRDDGSVGVCNRGFDRKTCRWKEADGRAVFQGGQDTASLSVTFFWPFAGGYHVFALDQQDYGWALVSGPSRNYLWILARRPNLSADIKSRLVDKARSASFPVEDLILVDHSDTNCTPGG